MLLEEEKRKFKWFGVSTALLAFFVFGPLLARLSAQSLILGELEFKGASKVEKTSGVWIDGQYVGYMDELHGRKKVLLLPGDHELSVRQAGYQDFNEKLTVEPKILLLVPVRMQKATGDVWPSVTADLKVDVKPKRAAVFVDQRFLGHAGEMGGGHSMLLSPGTHRIKIELPGYQTFETDVTLTAGQKSVVKTELTKGSIHQADSLINQADNNDSNK